jgi:adenylate cyclase
MLGRAERESGQVAGAQHLGICFADLVGFTRLGGQIEVEDLGRVAGNLAELANETARPPVRLVKTIGDAAMFVSSDIASLVDAALSLVEATEKADLPALRAGIACGDAIVRAGDYYGNPVNLASRVTGMARPGSVLCTEDVRDAAEDRFEWSYARKHRIKGVEDLMPLYRARRLPAGSQDGAGGAEEAKKPKADRRRKRASR